MRILLILLALMLLLFSFILIAEYGEAASLVGDEVIVQFITADTIIETFEVTVTDDNTDIIDIIYGYASLNMGSSGVEINFPYLVDFEVGSFFSGIKISDMDYLGKPKFILKGVSVDTNTSGWADNRLEFDEDWVSFNWQGLTFETGQYFNATFTFGLTPEAAAAAMIPVYYLLLFDEE